MGSSSNEKRKVYCWPWVGIVANIQDEPNSCGFSYRYGYWFNKFSKYSPLGIEMFCGNNHRKALAVLRFGNDMSGFKNATEFEKSFEADGRSKKEWDEQRHSPGLSLYGWFAREDDFISEGPVGDYLRRNGELKKVVEIDLHKGKLDEKTLSYSYEDTRKSQHLAREHVKRVSDELELLNNELPKKKKRLDSCSIKLERKIESFNLWRAELKNREEKMKEKDENLEYLEDLNTQLFVKERQSNVELQEACKELIEGFTRTLSGSRARIGIKRMGEIDEQVFKNACRERCSPEEADIKAVELYTFWRDELRNPNWHPFQIVEDRNGKSQYMLKEDDKMLVELKQEYGDEAFDAVVTALKEMLEHNPSGCYVTRVLWNFRENRKAALKEAISYVFFKMEALKRRRT